MIDIGGWLSGISIAVMLTASYVSLTENGDPRADDPPVPVYWLDNETIVSCGPDQHLRKWDGTRWENIR